MIPAPPITIARGPWPADEHVAWDQLIANGYRLLERRIAQYGVPDFRPTAVQDLAIVFRLPGVTKNRTASGLFIPDVAAHDEVYSTGILLWAGLEALDVLDGHGVFIGDVVTFGRFAGDEEGVHKVQEAIANGAARGLDMQTAVSGAYEEHTKVSKLLKLKVSDIQSSVDLGERLTGERPVMKVVRAVGVQGLMYQFRPVVENVRTS